MFKCVGNLFLFGALITLYLTLQLALQLILQVLGRGSDMYIQQLITWCMFEVLITGIM